MRSSFRVALPLLAAVLLRVPAATQPPLIIDNDGGAPAYTDSGDWALSGLTGYADGTYVTRPAGDGSSWAAWTGAITTAGPYRIHAHFRAGTNRATDVPFSVTNDSDVQTGIIDQSGVNELVARPLGVFDLAPGAVEVRFTNGASSGFVIADAIEIAPWTPTPPVVAAPVPEVPRPFAGVPFAVSVHIETDGPGGNAIESAGLEYTLNGSLETNRVELSPPSAQDEPWTAQVPALLPATSVAAIARATSLGGLEGLSSEATWTIGPDRDTALATPAYSVLLAGQSNASGRGTLGIDDEPPDDRVLLFGNDYEWKVAFEPIDDARNQVDQVSSDAVTSQCPLGHSFALTAAKGLLASLAEPLRVIPAPHGGTTLNEWMPAADPHDRTTLFGSANVRVEAAAFAGTLDALWWWQGESDAGSSGSIALYPSRHATLISAFRFHWGAELPVVYVQLARTPGSTSSGLHQIAEHQRRLETGSGSPEALPRHHMVVAFDAAMCDNFHVDLDGQKEIGRRVALAMREHVFGEPIDGTGPRLIHGTPLVFADPSRTAIRIVFDRPIKAATANFDNLFRVFDGVGEVTGITAARDPANDDSVLLTLPSAVSAAATVSYGDRQPPAPVGRLTDIVRGESNLPAPRFGPLPVAGFSEVQGWRVY